MNLFVRPVPSVIALTLAMGLGLNLGRSASAREVRVYSGRHYNTDRKVFKKFNEETGIKVRLIEATGISLIERLRREGKKSKAGTKINQLK